MDTSQSQPAPAADNTADPWQTEWNGTSDDSQQQPLSEEALAASGPFVGRWNQLVSTTNWEKGRIVHGWREALQDSAAPPTEFSDEAWARLVGGVTGQHVGRLRRVFARFGDSYSRFEGLFWSHFQAALDWDDAELWLEGAVQSKWSVSQMRRTRWEAHDAPADLKPRDEDIIATELDEDFEPARHSEPGSKSADSHYDQVNQRPTPEGPDFGDEDSNFRGDGHYAAGDDTLQVPLDESGPAIRPFADIGQLPDDVADAFESFKLSIIRHKNAGWKDISCDEMQGVLDSLKELALTPGVVSEAPF